MSIDMATLALMGAVQALLMAIVLWTSTGSYAGVARASLRLRAGALVLEATAWVLLGLRGQVGDWLSILVANAVVLLIHAGQPDEEKRGRGQRADGKSGRHLTEHRGARDLDG